MAEIAKIQDVETKTELQTDVERLQHLAGLVEHLAGLVASFSKDLHQQIRIAIKKHGSDAVVSQIGCSKSDLQNLCDSCTNAVTTATNEKLPSIKIAISKAEI